MIIHCCLLSKYNRTLLQGKTSHKFIDMSENPIMRLYYTNRMVLFFMCAGNEAFYAGLYLLHFTEGPICKYHCNFTILSHSNVTRNDISSCSCRYRFVQIDRVPERPDSTGQSRYLCTARICSVHQSQHNRREGTPGAT